MAISGCSPYAIACRTFQSLAPFSSVSEADLSSVGDLGRYPDNFRGLPETPELFLNDQRMTVARWPNDGWATIASIVDAGAEPRYGDQSRRPGVFTYSGDDPAR